MANSVHNIPINVMPQNQAQGPVVPNNNGVIDDSAAENAAPQIANENRAYEADAPPVAENTNRDTESNSTEGKGDNFQDVLDRKLSNKPEDKNAAADGEKPKNTDEKGKEKANDNSQDLAGLIDIRATGIKVLTKGGTKNTEPVLLKGDQNARPVTNNKNQQKIVDIPAVTAQKDAENTLTKGQQVAEAATTVAKAEPTEEGAVKGEQVKQAVQEIVAKDAKPAVTKTDTEHPSQNSTENNKQNTNKLNGQEIAAAKQNINAVEKKADQAANANKPVTENKGELDVAKTTDAADKTLKTDILADAKVTTETIDIKPKEIENTQPELQTENNNDTDQTLQKVLGDQNAKNENKKLDANTEFNYTKAQNETAVGNAVADAPAANTNNQTNSISGVQSATSTGRTTATAATHQPQSPTDQIIDAVKNQDVTPGRQISMTLNPGELGRVRISFQQENGEITGLVEVEKAQTRYDVEKNMPQIIASLQDSGLQVKRIDVTQDSNPDSNRDQQKADLTDQFEQANSKGYSDSSNNSGQPAPQRSARSSQAGNNYQQAQANVSHITDKAISAYA